MGIMSYVEMFSYGDKKRTLHPQDVMISTVKP